MKRRGRPPIVWIERLVGQEAVRFAYASGKVRVRLPAGKGGRMWEWEAVLACEPAMLSNKALALLLANAPHPELESLGDQWLNLIYWEFDAIDRSAMEENERERFRAILYRDMDEVDEELYG